MFECSMELMLQLVDMIPGVICIYIIFDFMGSLLFNKR